MNVILSINPNWAEKIYRQEKILEFRKTIPKTLLKCCDFYRAQDVKIYLYETGKKGSVTGFCNFRNFIFSILYFDESGKIIKPKNAAFDRETFAESIYYSGGQIKEEDLFKYSLPQKFLYVWRITNPKIFEKEISISEFGLKRPPQSFCYTNKDF